jgi:hypothetical protein
MNQNLFRVFTYMSTSSFFNAVSSAGMSSGKRVPLRKAICIRRPLTGAIDFRVGAPWGKDCPGDRMGSQRSAVLAGALRGLPDIFLSSALSAEFGERLNVRAVAEDLRAWRVVGTNSGIAQNLRPAGTVRFQSKS